jgi:SAM-dependent methyltransferase
MGGRRAASLETPPPRAFAELVQQHAHDPHALWEWIHRVQETQGAASGAPGAVQTPVHVAQRMAARLLHGGRRGERLRLLDAGCGAGRLLAAALQEAAGRGMRIDATGIELDAAAARWAAGLEPMLRAAVPAALAGWRIAQADFLLEHAPRPVFDAAIANPPYVALRDLTAGYRAKLRAGAASPGRGDLSALFVTRMLRCLRPGGRLCVIVPNKILAAGYGAELRRQLLERMRLLEIWNLSGQRVFRGRATYPVVLVVERRAPDPADEVALFDADASLCARWRQQDLLHLPRHVVPLGLPTEALPFLRRLLAGPRFGDRVSVACGIATSGFAAAMGRGPSSIICSGDIRPFRVNGRRRFAPERVGLAARSLRRQQVAKVVIPGMFQRLHAAYDGRGDLLGRVYYVPIQAENARQAAERRALLLALLNSRLYAVLYRGLFGAVAQAGGYIRLNAPYLRCLPWPQRKPPEDLVAVVRRLERGADRVAQLRLDQCVEGLFALRPEERRLLRQLESHLYGECPRG